MNDVQRVKIGELREQLYGKFREALERFCRSAEVYAESGQKTEAPGFKRLADESVSLLVNYCCATQMILDPIFNREKP